MGNAQYKAPRKATRPWQQGQNPNAFGLSALWFVPQKGRRMKQAKKAALLAASVVAVVVSTTGCATTGNTGAQYSPVVDRPGPNYAQDLADCQAHASKVMSAAQGAGAGAVAGAIFGALLMAAAGANHADQRSGAWVGALSGGAGAAANAEGGQRGIITRCLSGRGYVVLQ